MLFLFLPTASRQTKDVSFDVNVFTNDWKGKHVFDDVKSEIVRTEKKADPHIQFISLMFMFHHYTKQK